MTTPLLMPGGVGYYVEHSANIRFCRCQPAPGQRIRAGLVAPLQDGWRQAQNENALPKQDADRHDPRVLTDYYPTAFRFDQRWHHVIYCDDDNGDDLIVTDGGKLLLFTGTAEAHSEAIRRGLTPWNDDGDDYPRIDLDPAFAWASSVGRAPDPVALNDAWNFTRDVSRSLAVPFPAADSFLAHHVYNKLFWGLNLPAVTPAGRHYTPRWTPRELATLRRVIREGAHLMRQALPTSPSSRAHLTDRQSQVPF